MSYNYPSLEARHKRDGRSVAYFQIDTIYYITLYRHIRNQCITKCIDFTQAVLFIALANLITVMYRKNYKVQKSEFREEKAS